MPDYNIEPKAGRSWVILLSRGPVTCDEKSYFVFDGPLNEAEAEANKLVGDQDWQRYQIIPKNIVVSSKP